MINPATEEAVAKISLGSEVDVNLAVSAAKSSNIIYYDILRQYSLHKCLHYTWKEYMSIIKKVLMPNNLFDIIHQSDYTNKEIAKLRGVSPETLSRHIHGHINMSIRDVEKYAEILKVRPQDILFKDDPIPIIGECHADQGDLIHRNFTVKPKQAICLPDHYNNTLAAVFWSCSKGYRGPWSEWNGAYSFYLKEPIVKNEIHPACIQKACLIRVKKPLKLKGISIPQKIFSGVLYPEPDDIYTLHAPGANVTLKNLELSWASPLTSVIFRPALLGCRIVDL